jgi:serine/threonine protein kinase
MMRLSSPAVDSSISSFSWKDISLGAKLGEGASGYVYKADWTNGIGTTREVAVKLFKGEATSDGSPEDEMKVSESCLSAQCCCDDPRGFRCVSKQVTIHVWCQPLQNIKRMVMMPRVRKR